METGEAIAQLGCHCSCQEVSFQLTFLLGDNCPLEHMESGQIHDLNNCTGPTCPTFQVTQGKPFLSSEKLV